jgi:aminoglycoside phosphotransferase (APT) family kinase protein
VDESSLAARLSEALRPVMGPVDVGGLRRLSGGASRETWAFEAGGRQLILRRDPEGRPSPPGAVEREAAAIRAAGRAGLEVPEVLLADGGRSLGTAGMVMSAVPGETIARRILRDSTYATAREALAGQIGRFLGQLHSLDPSGVPGLVYADPLDALRASYEAVDDRSDTFDAAFEWLSARRPASAGRVVVHGDMRLGNLIVGPAGLEAVIDWELVHLGDPMEDLAWVCTKAWRFGSPRPVAGVGDYEDLFAAYESASGNAVDRDAFGWWLVLSTLRWGVICMTQAAVHLTGASRSVELAAIGRRVAEQEWDLVELIAPEEWAAVRGERRDDAAPDDPGIYGRPTARELLQAVREFLAGDVAAGTEGRLAFHAKVAANVVAIVERELAMAAAHRSRRHAGSEWHRLASAVRDRLEVANPKHL